MDTSINENDFSKEDPWNPHLCKRCGQQVIDRSENPDSVLCAQCRKELIRYPIPGRLYAALALIAVLFALALAQFPRNLKDYKTYETAWRLTQEGMPYTALQNLRELAERYPDSREISLRLADIGMSCGYYDAAAFAIDTYLTGRDLTDTQYTVVTGYIDTLNRYYDTLEAADAILSDPGLTDAQTAYAGLEELAGQEDMDQALLHYYLAYVSPDEQTSLSHFEQCYSLNPDIMDAAAQIGVSYRRQGALTEARELLEEAYVRNREDSSLLRALATLELADNQPQRGLEYATNAYGLYPEGTYIADTYLIALAANGRAPEAQALKQQLLDEGYTFDAELDSFLAGGMTLQEYYIGE